MKLFVIWSRTKRLFNMDPQNRCYDGQHYKAELRWTEWAVFHNNIAEDRVQDQVKFWRELNDYAVSQRGESARIEFEVTEQGVEL